MKKRFGVPAFPPTKRSSASSSLKSNITMAPAPEAASVVPLSSGGGASTYVGPATTRRLMDKTWKAGSSSVASGRGGAGARSDAVTRTPFQGQKTAPAVTLAVRAYVPLATWVSEAGWVPSNSTVVPGTGSKPSCVHVGGARV